MKEKKMQKDDDDKRQFLLEKKIQSLPKIDCILNESGYNFITWKIILLTGFYIFVEGSQLTLLNSLFVPIKEAYNLTDNNLTIANSLMFLGVAIGSILSGYTSSIMSRRKALIIGMCINSILNFILSLNDNFTIFNILRIFLGFSIGIMLPMIFGILSEYLPIQYRGFCLIAVWCFYGIGGLYVNITMKILMHSLQSDKVNMVIFYLTIPYILFSVSYFIFLEESPRNLILNNKESNAIEILEKIKGERISEEVISEIISNVKGGINKNLDHSLASVFAEKLRKTTIIQSIIWFCFSYIFYGGIFSISLMLKEIGFSNQNLIEKTMIVYGLSMPGNLIGGILTEISYLGRLKTCMIGYGFLSFFIVVLPFFPNHIEILIGFMGLFLNISFNVTCTYCSEYYPTRIRDTALGYLYFITRISGFISQFISYLLIMVDYRLQYLFILSQTIFCFILIFHLPEETHGQPLDVDYDTKNRENKVII